ncbi:class I SAM-dependent methyltransferase [Arvimicrobium flavum]|uniref:class I SAM-dependent methyltransferase n=1 Tax=Arvimicrobium flavum TaxID=3393320 RepID=UPI00237A2372|nr:class I SAM-dependent methyltransferase [Mesorhizobium shangrilense]
MAKPAIPERISWAVERLALGGHEAVLEIGCGRGVAATLVSDRLTGGRLVAIDRSSTATEATRERPENRAHAEAGRLQVLTNTLADLSGYDAAFDVAFAINVNLFWLDPARELPVIRRILKPGGRLELFYEAPSAGQADKVARLVEEKLGAQGFAVDGRLSARSPNGLIHISLRQGDE